MLYEFLIHVCIIYYYEYDYAIFCNSIIMISNLHIVVFKKNAKLDFLTLKAYNSTTTSVRIMILYLI